VPLGGQMNLQRFYPHLADSELGDYSPTRQHPRVYPLVYQVPMCMRICITVDEAWRKHLFHSSPSIIPRPQERTMSPLLSSCHFQILKATYHVTSLTSSEKKVEFKCSGGSFGLFKPLRVSSAGLL